MSIFRVGDEIICIRDCYDNHGAKLHSVGEKNKIFQNNYTLGMDWYIKMSDDFIKNFKYRGDTHRVDEEYLLGYFVTFAEYRKLRINDLLEEI